MEIKGRTIVITGAARGLGQHMAEALARRGARLALVDQDDQALRDIQTACRDVGSETQRYGCDVSSEAAVEQLFQRIRTDFGGIDALVNNAGINRDALLVKATNGAVETMSLEDFTRVLDVDLVGVFLCGRETAAHMVRDGHGGVIVNISSISRHGNPGQSNYAAAKAGVEAMTVTWARELARYSIRVAGIAPGFSDTRMVARLRQDLVDSIKARIPLGRLGDPREIAHAAVFVLENDYFNGRTLEIDGGLRL